MSERNVRSSDERAMELLGFVGIVLLRREKRLRKRETAEGAAPGAV